MSGRPPVANRASRKTARIYIHDRKEFNANGTLFGSRYLPSDFGSLPKRYWNDLQLDSEADDFYVVLSYQTPIAWFSDDEWHVPNVWYSATTTKHMGVTGIPVCHGETNPADKWVKIKEWSK